MFIKDHPAEVGILGAGIMGSCLALELAQRGHRVDLIDRAPAPMTGASLHNEGKLHLGFVYAKDPLKATHSIMLRGSLVFARIIEKLSGCGPDALIPSQPFHYFVPASSQLDMASIEQHFHVVQEAIREASRNSGDLYLGRRFDRYYERNASDLHSRLFSPESTLGSFRTEELSVSTDAVARILCRAVKGQPNIRFIGNTEVLAASRLAAGFVEIRTRQGKEASLREYPCVANCLWEDRLRIDQTAGIADQGTWIYRYKATINISAPASAHDQIPSATGVLGPYGDVVNHNNGVYYLSWYPLCKLAQSTDGDGQKLYDMVHKWALARLLRKMKFRYPGFTRFVSALTHGKFIHDNISEMAAYIPSLASLLKSKKHSKVGGGIIVARGATDIDDPQSYLHQRSHIGPVAHGSYVTIDTGKYCTAPLFAVEAADKITEILS